MKLSGDNVEPFVGNVSVRCPIGSRPLIIFGQDELIFNQFSHSGKQWLGPLGQCSIMPKSAGMGLMLSSFQSQEVSAPHCSLLHPLFIQLPFMNLCLLLCNAIWLGSGNKRQAARRDQ